MTLRTPCSIAFLAASSAASCAANGVDLREPLKPQVPEDDQATTLPETSVIDTMVLLNVALMCATPVWMFFRTFFFALPLVVLIDLVRSLLRHGAELLDGHPARTLTGSGVGVRTLAAIRKVPAMTAPAVAVEIDEPLDVQLDVAAEIALNAEVCFDRVADLAMWMRQQDATNPAPYLMLRGLRWGELRAGRPAGAKRTDDADVAPAIDPRMLVAPTTSVRTHLKSLSLDGQWNELLEACEAVMARPEGRGWLDLQRYALKALTELGEDYSAVAEAIRGAMSALLRDRPALATMSMMDDSPTANAETRGWIAAEFQNRAEQSSDAARGFVPVEGDRPQGRGAYDRAMEEVRAGSPHRAIELLMRELARERTPRGRFLRHIDIARIMVDSNLEAVAQPILEELQKLIETHQLEQWEAGELIAKPLTLLYRVHTRLGVEAATTQPIYLRICRLDPLQAMSVSP